MSQQKTGTNGAVKALIVLALVMAVGVAIYAKNAAKNSDLTPKKGESVPAASVTQSPGQALEEGKAKQDGIAPAEAGAKRPKLIDLGADKCIPCKMMAPILEEMKKDYAGKLDVVFIDVWKNADAGMHYGINLIPTQIFIDAAGKELFRHEGFFAKEDILAKWKELGVNFAEVKH